MTLQNYSDLEVKDFFETLARTGSTKAKKQLLAEKRENDNVKQFLDYLLNPFFLTGISVKKMSKPAAKEPSVWFDSFHALMGYIRENHTGTDDILANVQAFLESTDERLREFYIGIITKTIRIGCDVRTVNDALKFELIPQWEVQQAYQIGKVRINENEWFSLSQKLNGVRGTYFEGKLISRQGREFSGLDHILADIRKLIPDCRKWVLDGELIRQNTDNIPDNENFRLSTGIINQDDGDKSAIQMVIFDILPKEEFIQGESRLRYHERLEQLSNLRAKIQEYGLSNVAIVDILYNGTDASKIWTYLEQMTREGKEGLMLNRDCPYRSRRHNGILKVKRFYSVDLEILGLEEGSGRLKGTLGAFVVRYKNNLLHVGTGMSDEQRKIFWEKGDSLVGRVIEVKYKEESRDKKTGLCSLQFPVFIRLREAGKAESYD